MPTNIISDPVNPGTPNHVDTNFHADISYAYVANDGGGLSIIQLILEILFLSQQYFQKIKIISLMW